jgi:maltose alpha-D-glucosyltransferase/alpha-amylase
MQWNSDKNAGFSRASPQALYLPIILDPEYHYEAVNVEAQRSNPSSLFWWVKRTLTLRKRHKAFGRGSLRFLHPENRKILAFVRREGQEVILVVANLSRFHQPVHLDLTEFKDLMPVELMGRAVFPVIGEKPYFLTLGPHVALWFSLERSDTSDDSSETRTHDTLLTSGSWTEILEGDLKPRTEMCLGAYLKTRAWFDGRGRVLKTLQVQDAISVPATPTNAVLLILLVEYMEGDPERYLVPVSLAMADRAERLERECPEDIIARVKLGEANDTGVVYNAAREHELCRTLFEAVARRRSFCGADGELKALRTSHVGSRNLHQAFEVAPSFNNPLQNNRGIILGDKYFLKLFRRLEVGVNPELEMGRFLTEKRFANVPALVGAFEYRRNNGEGYTLGVVTEFKPNVQDAWAYTLDLLSRYFDRARTASEELRSEDFLASNVIEMSQREVPEPILRLIGTYSELARLLGQRTAELHLALTCDSQDPAFAPEAFTPFYQRALFQSMRNLAVQSLDQLRRGLERVPEAVRPEAQKLLGLQAEIVKSLRAVYERPFRAKRIRCHGDFHLGEVLFTGKDFLFIDFEGDRTRPVGERRIKRSPFRDVAGMLRSFDYISAMALFKQLELGTLQEHDLPMVEPWANLWYHWVSAIYLKAYLAGVEQADLLPRSKETWATLLQAHLLEKTLYEAGYELKHRPHLLRIPLRALLTMLRPQDPK